tara:strand:- start:4469 stop:5527 length:1059 start_codon:yes stop_codon:yes gene_type:complete
MLIWLMLLAVPAFSLTVEGLYTAQVPIKDQSSKQVLGAKKIGLAQVIVKVTGQTQSLNHSGIRAALKNAETYLQRFSFSTTQLLDGQPQAMMELAFDRLQVDQLMRDSGMPIWGTDRAAVLVWLVEDKQGLRQIVNDNGHPMVAQIMAQADQRGMPLLWPLLDLEDQVSINAGALWGLFRETIKQASSRYQADAVLVGRMFQDSQQLWRVEWNFWLDEVEQTWSSQGANVATLVDPLQDRLASSLVAKFALTTSAQSPSDDVSQSAILRIDQVTQIDDYVDILAMLKTIAGIQRVQLHSANGSTLEFRIIAQSQLAQVKSIVDLKRRLQAVDDTAIAQTDASKRPVWHYQWN